MIFELGQCGFRKKGSDLKIELLAEISGKEDLGQEDLGQEDLGQEDLGQEDLGQEDLNSFKNLSA